MRKIDIPKEKLIDLYVNKHLTMSEIGDIYNVNRTTISNKLKCFGISPIKNQRKFIKIKNTPLTQKQRDLILGSVLGDGSIILSGRRKNAYFKVGHCEKQYGYLLWKFKILNNFSSNINKRIDTRGNSVMYSFNTLAHEQITEYRSLFYENNVKIIRDDILDSLNSFGLAVWFMDDGTKTSNGCNYRIATDGFSKEDNYKLKNILHLKFDLNVNILSYLRNNKTFYYLSINKVNAIKMTNLIKRYVVECMRYKLIDPQRLNAKLP